MKYLIYAVIALCFSAALAPVTVAQQSCSMGGTQTPVELAVPNLTGGKVSVYWLDFQCVEQLSDELEADEVFYQSTFDGHEWIFRNPGGQEVSRFTTSSGSPMVLLGGDSYNAEPLNSSCSSAQTTEEIRLSVINNTGTQLLLFWVGFDCTEWLYQVVPAKNQVRQNTYVGSDWVVRYVDGKIAEHATVSAQKTRIIIDPPVQPAATPAVAATPVVTVDETGGAFPITESGCEVASVTADLGVDAFYKKYCDFEGLLILGSDGVEDAALHQAWLVTANVLYNRPDVVASAATMGFHIVIMADDEVISDVPEMAYLSDDPNYDYDQDRNYEKALEEPRLVLTGEENLLCYNNDTRRGENRLVHSLATITRFVMLRDLRPEINDEIAAVRQHAIDNGIWANSAWITENNGNYWNYGVQTYFNSSYDGLMTGPSDDYTNTRLELADYDAQLLDLIDSVYQSEDWTPACPGAATDVAVAPTVAPETPAATSVPEEVAPQPTDAASTGDEEVVTFPITESGCDVASVTADLGVDAFYKKYCDFEGLLILGSDGVDDAALRQAWLVTANVLYNRPDVVASAATMGFHIVIMADDEVISDVPEMAYLSDDPNYDYDQDRNYEKALEEPRLVLTGEENLLCYNNDTRRGENRLVHSLATITRFVMLRDLKPEINDEIAVVRQHAIDNGIWANSAWITENNGNYWNYGVQTYFNSSYDGLMTGPSDDYTNTRVELADYDAQLLDLIDSVYQSEDWTPACPTS